MAGGGIAAGRCSGRSDRRAGPRCSSRPCRSRWSPATAAQKSNPKVTPKFRHDGELIAVLEPMLLGRARNPPGCQVAACPGIAVSVAPDIVTCEWVWPTATFNRRVDGPALQCDAGRHANHSALERHSACRNGPTVELRCRQESPPACPEKVRRIVDLQMIVQLLIAVSGHEIDGEPRLTTQILAKEDLDDLEVAGTAEENVPLCWPG